MGGKKCRLMEQEVPNQAPFFYVLVPFSDKFASSAIYWQEETSAELIITTPTLRLQRRWELLTKKLMSPYTISSTRQTRRK